MPRMPRFQIIPLPELIRGKSYAIQKIKDTKPDKKGRTPIFSIGRFSISKYYPQSRRSVIARKYEPKKQARLLNIRRVKK
tara:strand:+ start:3377 stop:3616 length:240 start_codon:yes stop_codon:yes gene_type:complete